MTIDWKSESSKVQKQLLKDLKSLVAVKSVRDDLNSSDDAPLGPGPRDGLYKFSEMTGRDKFQLKILKNVVGYLEYAPKGADDQYVAILAHVDVMPPAMVGKQTLLRLLNVPARYSVEEQLTTRDRA